MAWRRWAGWMVVVMGWLLLQGCAATGPKGSEMRGALQSVPAGYGRIVFFRGNSIVGGAVRPEVRLGNQVVGQSVPGGFFYVDAAPGRYAASASTETTASVDVQVVAGQTTYVRSAIGIGLLVGRVVFTVEGQVTAQAELPNLSYTGTTVARIGTPAEGAAAAAVAAPAAAPKKAPPLKRGDQFIYRVTDRLTGLTREAVHTVDRIDAERVHFNGGGRIEAKDSSVISVATPVAGEMDACTPPGGWTRPEMPLGASWSLEYARPAGSSCEGNLRLQARVVSDEVGPTALGEMPLVRIDYEGQVQRMLRYAVFLRLRAQAWYAPELGRIVRFESEILSAASGMESSRELVELIDVRRD